VGKANMEKSDMITRILAKAVILLTCRWETDFGSWDLE
jgi:hypothetical protein